MIKYARSLCASKQDCKLIHINDIINYLQNTKYVEAYEIIEKNYIHKPYFDLEDYYDEKPTNEFITELLEPIQQELTSI